VSNCIRFPNCLISSLLDQWISSYDLFSVVYSLEGVTSFVNYVCILVYYSGASVLSFLTICSCLL